MGEQLNFEDEEVSITLRRAWDRALRALSSRVNKPTFETHFRSLRPVALAEENDDRGRLVVAITLGVPSAFTREWVEKRHAPLIVSVFEEILDRTVILRFALLPKDADGGTASRLAPPTPVAPGGNGASNPSSGARAKSAAGSSAPDAAAPLIGDLFASGDEDALSDNGDWEGGAPRNAAPTAQNGASDAELVPAAVGVSHAPQWGATGPSRPAPVPDTRPRQTARPAANNGGANSPHPDAPVLNARYTFDTFVTGQSNRLAHAGAKAVADAPGKVYNPLFLYGPPGLGKTHLMHAIGNEIAAKGDGRGRVAYVSGETFTTNYLASLRGQKTEEFRRKWRSVDVWLVDDIQFIAGKEHTKEEFFHTFNTLYQTGKQIVISSDRSPRELRAMDERLRSRFECGLIADIAPPDLETRLAILHRKAESERARIPDEVLMYMARLVQSNIRTLEGALVKLIAYASLVNSPVTTQLAADVLERYYIAAGVGGNGGGGDVPVGSDGSPKADAHASEHNDGLPHFAHAILRASGENGAGVTAEVIRRVVARRFNIHPDDLSGKKRDRDVSHARQIAMHLMRELTEASLPGIGEFYGGRAHTTVMHSCDKIRGQMPLDDELRVLIEDLMTQVRAQQG